MNVLTFISEACEANVFKEQGLLQAKGNQLKQTQRGHPPKTRGKGNLRIYITMIDNFI